MTNRAGCGFLGWATRGSGPTTPGLRPIFCLYSIERFGIVPAGDEAPSDHYGLITEFPFAGPASGAVDVLAPGGLAADARRGAQHHRRLALDFGRRHR